MVNARKTRKAVRRSVELMFVLRSRTRGSLKVGPGLDKARGLRTSPVSWLGGEGGPSCPACARPSRDAAWLFQSDPSPGSQAFHRSDSPSGVRPYNRAS